ncbi:MAG: lycopene cyclase domain-containing protein [Patescibacteria group bacterium]
MDTKYAYLVGSLFFLAVWIVIFALKKETRKEMTIISFFFLPVVPILEYLHIKDYWIPGFIWGNFFGVEDFIFAFSFAGIASVIYQVVFKKRKETLKKYLVIPKVRKNWPAYLIFFGGMVFMIFSFFYFMLGVNSVIALIFAFLFAGLYMIMQRRDLLVNAIFSGLLMSLLFFLFYFVLFLRLYPDIIERWWQISDLSGNMIYGLPIEEVAWAFAFGFMFGPLYEFVCHLTLKKVDQNDI